MFHGSWIHVIHLARQRHYHQYLQSKLWKMRDNLHIVKGRFNPFV